MPGATKLCTLFLLTLFLTSCSSGHPSDGLGVYPKAVGAADEASAIQVLRTIASAEAQFQAANGKYGDFDALTRDGVLDQRFAGSAPNLHGYRFSLSVTDSAFSVNADPQTGAAQSGRHFFLDSSDNIVHVNPSQPASKTDPEL